jgi:hypothetical protein
VKRYDMSVALVKHRRTTGRMTFPFHNGGCSWNTFSLFSCERRKACLEALSLLPKSKPRFDENSEACYMQFCPILYCETRSIPFAKLPDIIAIIHTETPSPQD